ncbi:MAG: fasciclin domain-containing protein [Caldilineaceae bacterium]
MKKLLVYACVALTAVLAFLPLTPTAQAQDGQADIVDTAISAGNFNTLVAAVEAAGLVETLKGEGPFTVFAPTDEAFAAIPQETLNALLADPSGDLTQILLYHVVPGKVMAADVTDGLEATTVQGGTVKFTVADGNVMINDANIVTTDIETSNGVIHVIDAVILPPTAEEPATLPVTGSSLPYSMNLLIVVGILAALMAVTLVSRQRTSSTVRIDK